ncbi:phage regulatory protein/antirepressor Ant [Sinorhizobium meliloti]|uniref:phage regulatory protein/antirepressor Ant n=1 Tax=Rhizobium meliloti TaxID=382 RepID=UPI001F3649BC|nr:phage regulatory protein/antirepressor Ant [Sinorhizobium meliloti]
MHAERNPVVFTKNGEVFANSRDVAEFFGKEHRDVLRAIDNLLQQAPEMRVRNFAQTVSERPNPSGGASIQSRSFNMDRDGFTLLAMGFTGGKALKWKLRYIEAFNAMEAELRRIANSGPTIDLNDPGALRGLLLTYSEKALQLEKQVQELLPSQEALQRISAADGSLCITDAAKALQMRPSDLFDWLRRNGWIYKRVGASHDLGYSSKTQSGFLEHKVTTVLRADGSEKVTEQVRVTAKGLTKLALLIKPALQEAL